MTTDRLETRLIHAGSPRPRYAGAAVLPIFQSTVFEQSGEGGYHDVVYPRLNNLPNHVALGKKLASLEGGEDALITGSGMAAISATLLTVLGNGGHLLVQESLYGGTHNLLTNDFAAFGLSYDFIDANAPDTWKAKLRPQTRALYVETLTNPTVQVADHEAVVAFAREHGLLTVIDNTFASPVNFRPLEHGFDLSLHSATKYLNGHSDVVAGAVIGSFERLLPIRHRMNHLGGSLDAHACFLLDRGVKTLALRVRWQNQSAAALAGFLNARPEVAHVNHPSLEGHPQHARAKRLFAGCGGMLSFELKGGAEAADRMIARLRLPIHGPSLGGVETLITRPVLTSHAGMAAADRARLGIGDGLVRLSVGIEATEDLQQDFEQALA